MKYVLLVLLCLSLGAFAAEAPKETPKAAAPTAPAPPPPPSEPSWQGFPKEPELLGRGNPTTGEVDVSLWNCKEFAHRMYVVTLLQQRDIEQLKHPPTPPEKKAAPAPGKK